MASAKPQRRLVVNADDFGRSKSINAAVIAAHQRGILTTASLMVAGGSADEAVELAKENPRLGVGLHLTLSNGKALLPASAIPRLVNCRGQFSDSPVRAGIKYFFSREAQSQLAAEIAAQFERFAATGLALDHVNGHLHFHLHPSIFTILLTQFKRWNVRALRLTNDPLLIDWPLGEGRWFYRASHAFIFKVLARRAERLMRGCGIAHASCVFGLLENGRVNESYVLRLMGKLPEGESELYSHPSLDEFRHEYEALISLKVLEAVRTADVELIRYQDLWRNC
ncbi:MAG TPA: hopanoid biosynthesis-associated protein HpnK [Verrucomicrobiae bacterium]|nr:hopanoid biosynthesis-associated protein HpnK [Verrucomicrobiae bacterium]